MDSSESLSHSKWECKYHVIFIPKCRRKTLYEKLRPCLGVLAASYIVLFKKGDPLAWIFMVSASLLGGVYFPLALLPAWIRQPAAGIPMTPCLEALRGLLLQNAGFSGIAAPLGILAIWALVGLSLSYLVFRWALQKGRQTGNLGHY